jgi:ABC-2 type transport system permease protein
MSAVTYTRYEVVRCFRNVRFFLFSLAFPLILFFVIAGGNRHATLDGIKFPLYYMAGMMAWGTMAAVIAGGARIAAERSIGWTRQMRLTPLTVGAYFRAKILSGYLVALVTIALLALAGMSLGVRLSAGKWVVMVALILVALIPFAVLGVLLGHLLSIDSMGPALGGATTLFGLLGGAWGPLATHGVFHTVVECLPSYWLVQAGKTAFSGHGWPAEAWIVLAVWTVVLGRLAMVVYRRDTARV